MPPVRGCSLQTTPIEAAQSWLAITLAALGKGEEAIATARSPAELSPAGDCNLASVYALLGRTREAEEILARGLKAMEPFPLFVAFTCALLGREAETFEWLERAYETRSHWMYSLGRQPAFQRYHSHPRFLAILDRLGLPRPAG